MWNAFNDGFFWSVACDCYVSRMLPYHLRGQGVNQWQQTYGSTRINGFWIGICTIQEIPDDSVVSAVWGNSFETDPDVMMQKPHIWNDPKIVQKY